jgi:hypothetical protein
LQEETEVLGENLPQCSFVLHKSHMVFELEWNPGCCGEKPVTNYLSYGTAFTHVEKVMVFM